MPRPTRHSAEELVRSTLLGESPEIAEVRHLVLQFAPLPYPVLLTGETGTGKEVIARLLALLRSPDKFVAVNCGALSESILEAELFGHTKGAFTGAESERTGLIHAASGGTLFLDEIEAMPPKMQAALLRFIETGEVRPVGSSVVARIQTRLVCATNAPLPEIDFRKDLMYRISSLKIDIPPLRNRRADVPLLLKSFIERTASELGTSECEIPVGLESYSWPGNVRELQNFARILLTAGLDAAMKSISSDEQPSELRLTEKLRRLSHLSVNDAARVLGISRVTAWRHRPK